MRNSMIGQSKHSLFLSIIVIILVVSFVFTVPQFKSKVSAATTYISMAEYKKIKNGMTLEQVEKIVGGKGMYIKDQAKVCFKGSSKNKYAIKKVEINIDPNLPESTVNGKCISDYWFKYEEHSGDKGSTEMSIHKYTGKSKKLIIPNKIEGLPVTIVSVEKKGLVSLNVSKCKHLISLYCYNNKLKNLDLKKNKKLWHLDCKNNKLKKLDLKKNKELIHIECQKNQIKSLNVKSNKKLVLLMVDKKLKNSQLSKKLKSSKTWVFKEGSVWVYAYGGLM